MDTITAIIKQIYQSCDTNNSDSVPVSALIDFIEPYMPDNVSELHELKNELDPDGNDPKIRSSFFYQTMTDWVSRIRGQDSNNSSSELSSNCMGFSDDTNISPLQTAIFSIGLSPAMSLVSNPNNSNNNINLDTMHASEANLQEQLQKLQNQLYKTTNELDIVKQQLAVAEEQNDLLSNDLTKLQKLYHRDQHMNEEEITKTRIETDEIKQEADEANKKIQQLSKSLSNYEKQEQVLLAQITELENENSTLKSKMHKFDQISRERKRSLSDIKDELDLKEAELSALNDIITELKYKLDEKTELTNFYENENKFLKQRVIDIERLLQTIYPADISNNEKMPGSNEDFNSPKLMKQLANPISPNINTPVGNVKADAKTYYTSSPIKHSGHPNVELFSNLSVVTTLRPPHKNLKEELLEFSPKKGEESEEIKRMQEVLKKQESIKNSLWDTMKSLSADNEALLEFKQGYQELFHSIQEKDEIIKNLQDRLGEAVTELEKEKNLSASFIRKSNIEENTNTEMNNAIHEEKTQLIKELEDKLKTLEENYNEVKKTESLNQKMWVDRSTETHEEVPTWNIPITDIPESKRTNYAKQQIKMERLIERQEKTEQELARERGINTTLIRKHQELCEENNRIKQDLQSYQQNFDIQNEVITNLVAEKEHLSQRLEILEQERTNLHQQFSIVEETKNILNVEKQNLNESLQKSLHQIEIYSSIANSVRGDNEFLINAKNHLEFRLKEECAKQQRLQKQLLDLNSAFNLKLAESQKDLTARMNKMEELQKYITSIEAGLNRSIRKLRSCIVILQNRLESHLDDMDDDLREQIEGLQQKSISQFGDDLTNLDSNVQLIVQLFDVIHKYWTSLEVNISGCKPNISETSVSDRQILDRSLIDEICNSEYDFEDSANQENNFMSCLSEVSLCVKECLEIMSFENDTFLNDLEIDEGSLRHLTKSEMEEKFTSLALTLSFDIKTSKERYDNQKEKCNNLLKRFYAYLNYSIDLVKRFELAEPRNVQEGAVNYLCSLKDLSGDLLKSAVQCGVLRYEKRTANCWNFVINYFALLSQDSRQAKEICQSNLNQSDVTVPAVSSNNSKVRRSKEIVSVSPIRRFDKRSIVKRCVTSLFLIVLVFCIVFIFYLDSLCPKDGRRVCPLDWIISFFVKKIHFYNLL